MHTTRRLVRSVLAWPVESQQGSRRNALIASTALAQRRHERDEVEEFFAALALSTASSSAGVEGQSARRDVI